MGGAASHGFDAAVINSRRRDHSHSQQGVLIFLSKFWEQL
jgi:hypothetical protein